MDSQRPDCYNRLQVACDNNFTQQKMFQETLSQIFLT
uniref:Uncharacterized protein n=1 Tax=Anguilla anguilla TaxID=7936 RepID=A0A0E9UCD3_ANGAN